MIGKLTGRVDSRTNDHVIIDVNGVGYAVYCSERTLASLPSSGEIVSLYTDLLVKEDILQLYGFTSIVEKEWHRLLMTVQGIGAKASMAILGTLGPEGVTRAISMGDYTSIKAAKGVGPKTAQRVVIELKEKASSMISLGGVNISDYDTVIDPMDGNLPTFSKSKNSANIQAEVLSALINLGYSHGDAAQATANAIEQTEIHETPIVIKAALTFLGSNS